MALDISNDRVAQVSLGILDVTYDGASTPMIDKEGTIEFNFTESRVEVRAAGNVSKIAEFISRQDLETVSIPLLEAGSDAVTLMFGGITGGGGAPSLVSTAVLVVQSIAGTFTAHAASPLGESTISISDEEVSKPVLVFNCMADLTRDAGQQVWSFVAA